MLIKILPLTQSRCWCNRADDSCAIDTYEGERECRIKYFWERESVFRSLVFDDRLACITRMRNDVLLGATCMHAMLT